MIENDYIKKHISKINKNNFMVIDIGKCISKTIFQNKHKNDKITTILTRLSNNSTNHIKIEPKEIVKSYFINNTILEIYSDKIHNYSYKVKDTNTFNLSSIDYKISILNINNNPNLTSNYNYNLIEEHIETIIHFKNIFDIILKQFTHSNTYYCFKIKIKKPIEYSLLIENINTILSLF